LFLCTYFFVAAPQKIAAEGEGLIVACDYRENKKIMIPQKLRDRIMNIEESAGSSHIK
jgi:acyl-CoA thioesterase FadM